MGYRTGPTAQLVNASGTLEIKSFDGYPHAGKLYKAWSSGPPISNPTTGYIQAGDVQITLSSMNTIDSLQILRVFPDGTFYVLAQPSYNSSGTILHYEADGTLVDAAALPIEGELAEVLHQFDTSADGTVYMLPIPPMVSPGQVLEVQRLAFGPLSGFTSTLGFSPTATATATPAEAQPIFSIPNKDKYGYGPGSLGYDDMRGLGIAVDGSLWMGNYKDQQVTLMHMSPTGAPIEVKRYAPLDDQIQIGSTVRIYDVQVRENDPWVLMGRPAEASIARLDGTNSYLPTLARYPLPQRIDDIDVGELLIRQELAFTFGPSGEVLLSWNSPDTRVAILVNAAGKATPFHTDADGKTSIKSQAYYPGTGTGGGWTYKTRLAGAPGTSPVGYITSGSTTVSVTAGSPLTGLHVFNVNRDGSFYVLADEEGNSQVEYSTVLHYTGSGQLLGVARIPGIGTYSSTMRRLVVDANGTLYALVPQADSVAVQQPTFFPASYPLAIPVPPTPSVTPTPTVTSTPGPYDYVPTPSSTPASIDVLAQRASLVVEAEVISGDLDRIRTYQSIHVLRWLRPASGDTDYLNVEETRDESDRISLGNGHVILFLEPNQPGYMCQGTDDFYRIAGGLDGIYEIRGDAIGWAGLSQNTGWSVARFEAVVRSLPDTPATPNANNSQNNGQSPGSTPTDPLADLSRFVDSSDMIAEVDNPESGAATGTILYSFRVRKWLKRPPSISDNNLDFVTHCEAGRIGQGSGHSIVFLVRGGHTPDSWPRGDYLTGGPAGVYSILGGVIEMGGINHFQGWTVDRFEAAIRSALASPGTPDPTLQHYSDPEDGR